MEVLVVVDMQNDFVSGVLGGEDALNIVKHVVEKVKNFKGEVIFTKDTHDENYLQSEEGKNLPVVHCVKGTWGHEIIDELKPYANKVLEKPAFGSFKLVEEIKKIDDLSGITLIGLCTDICVISNALLLKAEFYNVPIYVDEACCAGVSLKSHRNALEAMKMCHIKVI